MTVIISLPRPQMIIMTADSRKTTRSTEVNYETFEPLGEPRIEYVSMTKVFPVPKVGCITLWGDVTRTELAFPQYLNNNLKQVQTVEDLRSLVDRFLRHELKAEQGDETVGFHIGGFSNDGTPKLYHTFYGCDQPRPEGQESDYRSYDHSNVFALYNGRTDFVNAIVNLLGALQVQVGIEIFGNDPTQLTVLNDFVTRYISRFTPDVGGEIHTVVMKPDNAIFYLKNSSGGMLPRDWLSNFLAEWL